MIFGRYLAAISVALIAVLALFITNESTKKTFSQELGNISLVSVDESEKGSEAWTNLKSRISSLSKGWDHEEFLKIKFEKEGDREEKLMGLCGEIPRRIYSSIFTETKDKLLSTFKKLCTISIRKILKDKVFAPNKGTSESADKSSVEAKLKELKNHTDSEENGRIEEIKELKELKEKYKVPNGNSYSWKKLLRWCQSAYGIYYTNKSANTWKVVNKYCKKD